MAQLAHRESQHRTRHVIAEIQFNLWPDEFELFDGQATPTQPHTAQAYQRLF